MRLLIHDVDHNRLEILLPALASVGVKAEPVSRSAIMSGLSGLDDVAARALVVLLGDEQGRDPVEDLQRIRGAGCENPIIFMSHTNDPDHIAAILNAGADDVAAPPCSIRLLLARARVAVRQRNNLRKSSIKVGLLTVHLDGRNPELEGAEVKLSTKEMEVLRLLALNKGYATSRRAIFDALYALSEYQPYEKAIDIHISNIRKKLSKAAPDGGRYIQTYSGRGYQLIAGGV